MPLWRRRPTWWWLLLLLAPTTLLLGSRLRAGTRRAEAETRALRLQHDALSAQLQVVYEHRSRLEKSLQKERQSHRRTKDDYSAFKVASREQMEAQKKQASALFQVVKTEVEFLKSQGGEMEREMAERSGRWERDGAERSRELRLLRQQLEEAERERDTEVTSLQETITREKEESQQLRRERQECHVSLQDAQVRLEACELSRGKRAARDGTAELEQNETNAVRHAQRHVQQAHDMLSIQHDQIKEVLKDHQNQLKSAKVLIEEYKRLKQGLRFMPPSHTVQAQVTDPARTLKDSLPARFAVVKQSEMDRDREGESNNAQPEDGGNNDNDDDDDDDGNDDLEARPYVVRT
ncbi:Golgi integral membrane protein 4-like isoform X2 [Lampetra fluviatilis]